jgi:hypothetical protein
MRTGLVHVAMPHPPKRARGQPELSEIHIRPAKNGFIVAHYTPQKAFEPHHFVFPTISGLVNHLEQHVRHLWLGGKTMEPRVRGAAQARRETQIETSGYPAAKLK